jgi:hypothetical protein
VAEEGRLLLTVLQGQAAVAAPEVCKSRLVLPAHACEDTLLDQAKLGNAPRMALVALVVRSLVRPEVSALVVMVVAVG